MEKQPVRNLSEKLAKIVNDAMQQQAFSACSIGYFTYQKTEFFHETYHCGYTEADGKGRKVDSTTVYDLASLTKPLVTVPCIMALVDKGMVRLDDELGLFFPAMSDEIAKIRLNMLLSHSSGLPAHRPYFNQLLGYPQEERKMNMLRLLGEEKLVYQPGSCSLYSDLGFILLGYLIEELTCASLADFWKLEIAEPMGLQTELYFPGPEGLHSDVCAVTGECQWSKRKLCGVVHDDNCRILGGVAGHAGLFGTLSGVMDIVENMLKQYRGLKLHPAYSRDTLKEFMSRRQASSWTYGFDTPTVGKSSSGRYFSENTVGHLGFTGTSFWLDLEKGTAIVMLTNRVLMGDDLTLIRKLRPIIHDVLMEFILANKKPD